MVAARHQLGPQILGRLDSATRRIGTLYHWIRAAQLSSEAWNHVINSREERCWKSWRVKILDIWKCASVSMGQPCVYKPT